MSNESVGKEWRRVKKEFINNLEALSSKDAEHQDVYLLMKQLLEHSKIKPSGGSKNGKTQTVP